MSEALSTYGRGVLQITAFRRLWIGLGLSSLGDWLGLLALTAMAASLAPHTYADQNFAIGGVLLLRVLPAVVMGPLAGYIADRLDRRQTLVVGDVLRGVVFVSIPIVHTLAWVLAATVIIEAISLVWLPAKDATVPNLVPRESLEAANRISIATTYGSALPAAGIFVLLSLSARGLDSSLGWMSNAPVALSLYFNAASFIVSGIVVATLPGIPRGPALAVDERRGLVGTVRDGWAFVAGVPVVRGLVVGITGAFAAGGLVVGLARVYVGDLGGGDPGYGLVFAAVFGGLALGMFRGPRLLVAMSRRRLFGFSLVAAGIVLAGIALIANLVIATALTLVMGFFAGSAWITGYTLLGLEVSDALRGRTFAFVQTLIRLSLAAVLALGPLVAGVIGEHSWHVTKHAELDYNGAAITMFAAGLVMIAVGWSAYHLMNDRPGVTIRSELRKSLIRATPIYPRTGLFVAFEGGEGAGKSTQAALVARWLRGEGHEVVLTREPGDSAVGATLREILLSPATGQLGDRAEALLYAADKAEHVDKVVRPALERGAVVVTDRYVDSTLAYQGAGRNLATTEVEQVARWATDHLRPHLTVLLDVDPEVGLERFAGSDRLESEPLDFHKRVRAAFLGLASADPDHYLVLDATGERDAIAKAIRDRLLPLVAQLLPQKHDA